MNDLNLSISALARIQLVDNVTELNKSITFFFNLSPKRENLLTCIADIKCTNSNKTNRLIGMCKTRWSERNVAYEYFPPSFTFYC